MNINDALVPLRVIAEEDDDFTDEQAIRRGINAGFVPVIRFGAQGKSYKLTRALWKKFKRGEAIPDRYFLKKGAA